jgi:uncharacterized membrane protein
MTEAEVQELVMAFRTFTRHPGYRSALHVSWLIILSIAFYLKYKRFKSQRSCWHPGYTHIPILQV